jgi:hypothetical protein
MAKEIVRIIPLRNALDELVFQVEFLAEVAADQEEWVKSLVCETRQEAKDHADMLRDHNKNDFLRPDGPAKLPTETSPSSPRRPRIYVAGPYSTGDQATNLFRAIEVADFLLVLGAAPYLPHLTHHWDQRCPHLYEIWMQLGLAWVEASDALYRIHGFSPGADREEARAVELGLPVLRDHGQAHQFIWRWREARHA